MRLLETPCPLWRADAVFFWVIISTPSPAKAESMFPRWRRHYRPQTCVGADSNASEKGKAGGAHASPAFPFHQRRGIIGSYNAGRARGPGAGKVKRRIGKLLTRTRMRGENRTPARKIQARRLLSLRAHVGFNADFHRFRCHYGRLWFISVRLSAAVMRFRARVGACSYRLTSGGCGLLSLPRGRRFISASGCGCGVISYQVAGGGLEYPDFVCAGKLSRWLRCALKSFPIPLFAA